VRRTRRALIEALIALILERGWDGFSVQDLCERADVGRSTFYTHFADKEEVVAGGFEDLRMGLSAQLAAAGAAPARPLGFSVGLIEHAHEHRPLFRALVGRRSGQVVLQRFSELVRDLVREDLATLVAPGPRGDGTVAFVAGAFMGLLTWSLEARSGLAAKEVEELLHELAGPALAAASRRR